MNPTVALTVLLILLSTQAFTVTTYYPGNTNGPSAVDVRNQPPKYYPPRKPMPNQQPEQTEPNSQR